MKKFLIITFMAVCSLVCAFSAAAQSQKLPVEMLPEFVAEMNKTLPQDIDQSMVFSKVQLLNGGKQIDFVVQVKDMEIAPEEFIEACKGMSKQEIRDYFGPEFKEMTSLLPVPVSVNFIFKNGKTYRLNY
ncbi:MAG: hypothetical protein K2J87_01745 [Muribaculaceae bacterium]|nr:hypothetical protein [Muribaculaceae bacterium]